MRKFGPCLLHFCITLLYNTDQFCRSYLTDRKYKNFVSNSFKLFLKISTTIWFVDNFCCEFIKSLNHRHLYPNFYCFLLKNQTLENHEHFFGQIIIIHNFLILYRRC